MPHLVIEYGQGLSPAVKAEALIEAVYQAALASALFQPDAIKVRATGFDHYRTGKDATPFIHVTARILSGRTEEQKRGLSAAILNKLQGLSLGPVSLTVEVVDMHRASYAKAVT